MALIPVYPPHKRDKLGNFLLDKAGHKIEDSRCGTRMADADRTVEEQAHIEEQNRLYEMGEQWRAAQLVASYEAAQHKLGKLK